MAAPMIVPGSALGKDSRPAPGECLRRGQYRLPEV